MDGSNGTDTERNAVLELVGASDLNTSSFLNNYGLVRKTGTGGAQITGSSTHYGGGTNLNIEVTGGTLIGAQFVYFQNGGNIRVANGAEFQFANRAYFDNGGTLNLTGSGKVYLNAGVLFNTETPTMPPTINSAPGVFDCRGGNFQGPFNNAGEITFSAPSRFDYANFVNNQVTNSGTIHCLATS